MDQNIQLVFGGLVLVVAPLMWLYYSRKTNSTLSWKSDVKSLWAVVEKTLYAEKYWLLALFIADLVQCFLYFFQQKFPFLQAMYYGIAFVRFLVMLRFEWAVLRSYASNDLNDSVTFLPWNGAWWRYGFMDVVVGIPAGMGIVLFVVPGIMCLICFSLGKVIASYTKVGAWKALNESAKLVGGTNFPIAAAYLIPPAMLLIGPPIVAGALINDVLFPRIWYTDAVILKGGISLAYSAVDLASILAQGLLMAFTFKLYCELRSSQPSKTATNPPPETSSS